ncbi:MAG: hypothetical protein K6T63_15510 [Alicyclobacillus herbarius]|uniref:hypothetical protein n=1 Tax=Alicyclobacillus herbarius TaxID=122960 RepID=UPI00235463A9|nr:hypothetical protein [Alicyclobacillus herbarius]MCL6634023.1 hypothetical protein [Alicyclobacillus herbarius]
MAVDMALLNEVGANLANLVVKGTVASVTTKIKTMKHEKDIEVIRNTYDELINELLSEREEAIRIAQVYKNELEKIEISDSDIEHLHNTVTRVLEILKFAFPDAPIKELAMFQSLITADTLKAMQLLGFNFRAAIGEPLTELCAEAIRGKGTFTNLRGNAKNNGAKNRR